MTTYINADDGIVSGVAGLKYGADNSGSLVLQTNGTTAITISASQVVTFTNPVSFATASFTNLEYTGTLTGGTGVVNLGSGQFYKDASGFIGIGTASPTGKLTISAPYAAPSYIGNNQLVLASSDARTVDAGGSIQFGGSYTGTTYSGFAAIKGALEGSVNAGYMAFYTEPNTGELTERMRIDSSGNVGIGTASPVAKLDVRSDSFDSIFWGNAAASIRGIATFSGSTVVIGSGTVSPVVFAINSVEQMRLDTAGNFGIGTSSPTYKLQVRRAGGVASLGINLDNTVGFTRDVQYYSVADTTTDNTGHAFYVRSGSATDNLAMRIDYTGNVGIGLTTAGNRLVISQPVSTSFGTGGTYIGLGDTENSANQTVLIGFGYRASSTNEYPAVMGYLVTSNAGNQNGALVFGTRSVTTNTAPTERMRITSAGLVGIGTSSPKADIHALTTGILGKTKWLNSVSASRTTTGDTRIITLVAPGGEYYAEFFIVGLWPYSGSGYGTRVIEVAGFGSENRVTTIVNTGYAGGTAPTVTIGASDGNLTITVTYAGLYRFACIGNLVYGDQDAYVTINGTNT